MLAYMDTEKNKKRAKRGSDYGEREQDAEPLHGVTRAKRKEKCMTRAEWSNKEFRDKYYKKRKLCREREGVAAPRVRYGLYAFGRGTYRHNGKVCFA